MKKTNPNRLMPTGRQTKPAYNDGFSFAGQVINGGMGIVPRRGWDMATARMLESIAKDGAPMLSYAQSMPLRLLRILFETHEMAGMALSNDLGFTFQPGSVRVSVIKDYQGGQGTVDDSETHYVQRLENRTDGLKRDGLIPGGQGGGWEALQKTMARQQTTDGMSAIECVIGEDGVDDIIDFDPLSIRFADTSEGRVAQQMASGTKTGYNDLDLTTIRLSAWNGCRENPYGSPRLGRFLGAGFADIAEQRSLRDWLYAMAWPRIVFEFPIEQWVQYATQNPDVTKGAGPDGEDITPTQWAEHQVAVMSKIAESLTSSDFITMATGGKASTLNIAPGAGVADLLAQRRLRVAQSLDHPPALLGITDGGTQAYASTQLRQYGAKLAAVAADPDRALEWIVNLDLRARGVDMIARVERDPIILTDALVDQQARELEIKNGLVLVDRGIISPEENAVALSGGGMHDMSRAYTPVWPGTVSK